MADTITAQVVGGSVAPAGFLAQHWLTIIFGVFGLLGAAASIFSWYANRKSKLKYEYLLRFAELNIEKDITEKDIQDKKTQATKLAEHLDSLRAQIRRDVPTEARRAVLLDRFDASVTLLTHTHQDLLRTKKELDVLGSHRDLPKELVRAVESEIEPRYVRQQKLSNRKTWLTVISASAAASTLLPYPFGRYFGVALILLTIPFIVSLLRHSVDPSTVRRWFTVIILAALSVSLGVVAAVLSLIGYVQGQHGDFDYEIYYFVSFVFVMGCLGLAVASWITYRHVRSVGNQTKVSRGSSDPHINAEE